MPRPPKTSLQSRRSRDALRVAGGIGGVLLAKEFVEFGNLLATLPGLVVALTGSFLLWISPWNCECRGLANTVGRGNSRAVSVSSAPGGF